MMVNTVINFFEKKDKAKLEVLLTPDQATQLDMINVNVVEAMTGRGRTGIILTFTDADGKKYFCNTSARLIANGVAPACRGFMTRVGDNPDLP